VTAQTRNPLLEEIAKQLGAQLEKLDFEPAPENTMSCRSDTDGWCIDVGELYIGETCYEVQLWLDQWSNSGALRIYYGFYSKDANEITQLCKYVDHSANSRVLTVADFVRDSGAYRLKSKLKWFNKTILELYGQYGYWFGIYSDLDTTKISNPPPSLINKIFDFFEKAQLNARQDPTDFPGSTGFEGRKNVAKHLWLESRIVRSPKLAEGCKIKAKYKCEICGFDFERVYGEIGKKFLEAHHKVPLKYLTKIIENNLDDLLGVCSNCHRMLHRTTDNDWESLRKRMNGIA
jgi:hypothetical protein